MLRPDELRASMRQWRECVVFAVLISVLWLTDATRPGELGRVMLAVATASWLGMCYAAYRVYYRAKELLAAVDAPPARLVVTCAGTTMTSDDAVEFGNTILESDPGRDTWVTRSTVERVTGGGSDLVVITLLFEGYRARARAEGLAEVVERACDRLPGLACIVH